MNCDAVVVRWCRVMGGVGLAGLLWNGDVMEGGCHQGLENFGWCRISLRTFVTALELLLIKLLAAAVTVFDLIILIDGVIRDDFAFVEFTFNKTFVYNRTIGEHGWWSMISGVVLAGAEQSSLGFCCQPLNSGRTHPLLMLGVET